LNRFLALLLAEFVRRRDGWVTLYPNTQISSIARDPTDHDCIDTGKNRAKGTYDPTDTMLLVHECFEREHTVTFTGTATPDPEEKYNVIIARHGLLQAPKLNLKRTRHLLPYHRV